MIYGVNKIITMGFIFVLSLSILIELRLPKGNPEGEKEINCIRKIEDQHCLRTNYVKKRSPELILDGRPSVTSINVVVSLILFAQHIADESNLDF
jgi:hypothetical protein